MIECICINGTPVLDPPHNDKFHKKVNESTEVESQQIVATMATLLLTIPR